MISPSPPLCPLIIDRICQVLGSRRFLFGLALLPELVGIEAKLL